LPTALGIRLANPELTVIAIAGDGDGFGIGLGHFIHTARRNPDMVFLVLDNALYGQTKGQMSATTPQGRITASTPYGVIEEPINPIALAIISGATFVARAYSGRPDLLTDLLGQAIDHKGFAFLHILSPCVTFNQLDSYRSLNRECQPLPPHDPTDKIKALELAQQLDRTALGLFYQIRKTTMEEEMERIKEESCQGRVPSLEGLWEEFGV